MRGNPQRGHALHVAGGEPAEAAVAERGVGLELAQPVEVDAEVAQRLARHLGDAEIGQRVEQQAPDQEFEREVVDPLAAVAVGPARGVHPAVDDVVADRERRRDEPVVLLRVAGILADHVRELVQDDVAELRNVVARGSVGRWRNVCGNDGFAVAGRECHKAFGRAIWVGRRFAGAQVGHRGSISKEATAAATGLFRGVERHEEFYVQEAPVRSDPPGIGTRMLPEPRKGGEGPATANLASRCYPPTVDPR